MYNFILKEIKDNKELEVWNFYWENINRGNYNCLDNIDSQIIRNIYKKYLDKYYKFQNISENNLLIFNKEVFVIGYNRIVIGDHGPYIEFDKNHLKIKERQEFRLNNKSVKYIWYTLENNSNIKIYYQINKVKYADYKINKYYVSPFDIDIIYLDNKNNNKIKQNKIF